ncbi:hypothetical protein BC332_01730 [Capsicum chinense]|nr:hypothetical protein BC332_01730 [Capsicum chinense]
MGSTNQDEGDAIIGAAAISVLAVGVAIIVAYKHESSIPREPYVNKDQEREFYMNSILNGTDVHCVNRVYSSILPHCASSSFEALSNSYKITEWNHPTGDNEQSSILSLIYRPSIEKDVQVTEASQIKASRKRKRSFEVQDVVGDISIKFGEVAMTISRMVDTRLDVTKLYEEVMAMEGYNEEFLGDAFNYLVQKRHFSYDIHGQKSKSL